MDEKQHFFTLSAKLLENSQRNLMNAYLQLGYLVRNGLLFSALIKPVLVRKQNYASI